MTLAFTWLQRTVKIRRDSELYPGRRVCHRLFDTPVEASDQFELQAIRRRLFSELRHQSDF